MRILLLLTLSVLTGFSAFSQQEKPVVIDGKKFIMHTVEKGHTLYAISKKYSVSIEDIVSENPGAAEGVKLGDRLKIPVDRMDKSATKTPAPVIDNNVILHTVSKKETLYSIAKRYNVEPSDIAEVNPDAVSNLREGGTLKIPVNKVKFMPSSTLIPAEDGNSIAHQVAKQETLYSLSKLYNVSIEEIKNANGGINQGLREGMILRIPRPVEMKSLPVVTRYVDGSVVNPFQTQTVPSATVGTSGKMFDDYKVAILLPFELPRMDSLSKLGHELVGLEFYQGAMLAIDSLRQLGINMDVHIFDTNKDATLVKQLLQKPELSAIDLFIGPLYKSELMALSEVASSRNAHIVCPVPQAGGILVNRPYMSKAHCDDATQLTALARFIVKSHSRDNVVMINPMKPTKEKLGSLFASAYGVAHAIGGNPLKEVTGDVVTLTMIESKLVQGKNNVVYVASNELTYVISIINKLKELQANYEITLIGNEDWIRFDQIDNAVKNRLNLHLTLPSFVNYSSPVVINFIAKYREKYGTEPNKYGYLGYDVTMYYLYGMAKQGREFFKTLNQSGIDLTAHKFNLERPSESVGFNNFGAFVVRYNEFKLEIVE